METITGEALPRGVEHPAPGTASRRTQVVDQPASTPATLALTPGLPRAELKPALELCERLTERATQLKSTWVVPEDPVDRIVLATLARCQATFRVVLDRVL